MSGLKRNLLFGKLLALAVVATALGMALPALAQNKMNENDMEVPTNDMKVVEAGKALFSRRCAFCHGSGGHGAKGPCISCGVFHYAGNTNLGLYTIIATGVPKTLGGTMGAFGTTLSQEEIVSVIAYLRWEEKRRIEAGEIPDPYKTQNEEPMVFPKTN